MIKACGVLVVRGRPPEEFLLMVHPDRLDLPKGRMEPGETEVECALRELEEETGIAGEDIELDPNFRFTTSYRFWREKKQTFADKTTVIFLGFLKHPVPIVLTEHQGFQWQCWDPPHCIQAATIDPLLAQLERYLGDGSGG